MSRTALELGRDLYGQRAWAQAYARFVDADRESPLEADDLERLATAAGLIGRADESNRFRERAFHELVGRGEQTRAARCAFWIGFAFVHRGDLAQGGGWLARAGEQLDDGQDCAEQGFLLVPQGLQALFGGDASTAERIFREVGDIGDRFGEPDLTTLSRVGRGQALLRQGRVAEGIESFDRAMVAVAGGEVSPVISGIAYCATIEACHARFDFRRAQEWTAALTDWCDAQPEMVPFRGQCLVHRAEIMHIHGAWTEALDEAQRACELLSGPSPHPAIGGAWYEKAELLRLRGDFAVAEETYRLASQCGRDPQPGLALLRLAQGRTDAAAASIRRVAEDAQEPMTRSKVLAAHVEIELALDGGIDAARRAAAELAGLAAEMDAPWLAALSAYCDGAVALAAGDARSATGALRRAAGEWQELDAPYELARTRMLMAMACRALGDLDSAEMELDAARSAFRSLGAAADLSRLEPDPGHAPPKATAGLTGREIEVLALVATGKTNREIADALVISEKTVARHLSNIFVKLGVSSRAAATAYAFTHDLA